MSYGYTNQNIIFYISSILYKFYIYFYIFWGVQRVNLINSYYPFGMTRTLLDPIGPELGWTLLDPIGLDTLGCARTLGHGPQGPALDLACLDPTQAQP